MAIPQVLGPYQLKARIAVGGQSEVWLALRTGPGGFKRRCALKLLLPPSSTEPAAQKAFIAEARLMAGFNHPNLVPITDLGNDHETPLSYSVMPYISGLALSTIFKKLGTLPLLHATWILTKVLLALDFAHTMTDERGRSLNVAHRDISPENIIVSFDGQVYLIDFGIALSAINPRNTRVHVVKGKLDFLSPEQANASPRIDKRTDIYSLGLVYYYGLTGKNPLFGAPDTALERARNPVFHKLSSMVRVPKEIEAIWESMVRRRPQDRPKYARKLAREFLSVIHRMDPTYDELSFREWIETTLEEEIENEEVFLSKINQGTQVIDASADFTIDSKKRSATPVLSEMPDSTEIDDTVQMPVKIRRADLRNEPRTRDDLADILAELEDIYEDPSGT